MVGKLATTSIATAKVPQECVSFMTYASALASSSCLIVNAGAAPALARRHNTLCVGKTERSGCSWDTGSHTCLSTDARDGTLALTP